MDHTSGPPAADNRQPGPTSYGATVETSRSASVERTGVFAQRSPLITVG
jgi:hypothetical protein